MYMAHGHRIQMCLRHGAAEPSFETPQCAETRSSQLQLKTLGTQVVYGPTSPPRSIFRPTRSKFQPNPTFGLSDLRIIGTLPTLLT